MKLLFWLKEIDMRRVINADNLFTAARRAFGAALIVLVTIFTASAQITTPSDGQTPLGIQPGAPAGSYALSGFDNINLFNGSLNFRMPLLHIGGRGSAQMTVTLPIELKWQVYHSFFPGFPPLPPSEQFFPVPGGWGPLHPGYGPGVLMGRRASKEGSCGPGEPATKYTLTRLTFITPDGTEYELRDQLTQGKPADILNESCQGFIPDFYRGPIFVSADGSAMTFIADETSPITDGPGDGAQVIYPSGYLMLRDGSRLRIDEGLVTWIRDRNGNRLDFTYDQYKQVTTIKDSLNRTVTFTYWDPQQGVWNDEITFKGFGGAVRKIRVWHSYLHDALRSGAAQGSTGYTLKRMNQLFPELNGASIDFNDSYVISSVELPDGRHYRFFYNSYSELARVELPTGGAYEYDYTPTSGAFLHSTPPPATGFMWSILRRVVERRVYADGLTLEHRTTYTATEVNGETQVDVNHRTLGGSLLARDKHYFNGLVTASFGRSAIDYSPWQDGKEYMTEAYDTNGTMLRRSENTFEQREDVPWWSTWPEPGGGQLNMMPPNDVRLVETISTLKDVTPNQVTKQDFGYDQYNNRTDVWEYDFGQGGPPVFPSRHSRTEYVVTNPVNGVNYATNTDIHIRSLPSKQFVYSVNPSNGQETEATRAEFEYDKYDTSQGHALIADCPNISGHDSAFSVGYHQRGNLTSTRRWLNTQSNWISIFQQYDMAGNVVKTIDARGYATLFDYTDRFGLPDGEARSNSSPTELFVAGKFSYAFPTLSTNPLLHTTYTQYDYYLGGPIDAEDDDGMISSGYYNDLLDRPTQLIEAVNISSLRNQTTFIYNDAARIVTTSSDQNFYGDNLNKSETLYDGLGRQTESRDYETASLYTAKRQNFDPLGRVRQVSNPFRPGDTILWTTTDYDALSRVIRITTPDGAQVTSGYLGNRTTVTDQASKVRQSFNDALGRLVKAVEAPATLNYETTYSYNALDKLTTVVQQSQTRSFIYDSLGRLTQAVIPEHNGSTFYTYDANSNLFTKTDPRGVTTQFTYDEINRLRIRNYSDSTPDVTYNYDSPSVLYSRGKLTSVVTSVSSFTYDEYDALGRIKRSAQSIDGQNYAFSYSYNLAGNLTSETYPSGRIITTSHDETGRISNVTGQKPGEQAKNYVSQISYTAHDLVKQMLLGNGLWEHTDSNDRLQLKEIALGTSSTDSSKLRLEYTYNNAGQTDNNGNILSQKITIGSTVINQSYEYDAINRLSSVQETVSSMTRWTQSYGYDRWANRTSLINSGPDAALLLTQSTPPVNSSNNRLTGYTYDESGNVRFDPTGNSFTYDADNRLLTSNVGGVAGSNFYDGDGRRVRKVVAGVTTIFVYDVGGRLIAEYATQQPAQGGTSYLTPDHLGSVRVVTDAQGNVKSRHDYLPFGEEIGAGIGTRTVAMKYGEADGIRQRFTSKERDAESGLDYFGARYYSSTQGRFTGVDPLDASAVLTIPQSWNRYAYVLNNPLNSIDPDGMGWVLFNGYIGWDERVKDQADVDRLYGVDKKGRSRATYLADGTIGIITTGPYKGWIAVIRGARLIALRPYRPPSPKEINFWSGLGTNFLGAYLRFVAEELIGNLTGAKVAQAVDKLIDIAKASRASKEALEQLSKAVCFTAGTEVITRNGEKPIEKVKVGDEVLASDPKCGELIFQRVVRTFQKEAAVLLDIKAGGAIITCTPEHPFWVAGEGWVEAEALEPGSKLVTKEGGIVRVESINRREGTFKVYNLEVEHLHTYFVSKLGVLVHNDCNEDALKAFDELGGGEFYSVKGGSKIQGTLDETPFMQQPNSLYKDSTPWNNHTILVKEGKVWDRMANMEGVPFKDWASHWDWTSHFIRKVPIDKVKAGVPQP